MSDIQAIREAFLPIREMLPIKADRRDIYTAEKIYDVDGDPEPYVMFVCSPATAVWKNAIVLSINNIEALVERLTASEARSKAAEARVGELEAALKPFAMVAEHDIGSDETDTDMFRPMNRHNRAPALTVGDLRRARATLRTLAGKE